MPSARRPVLPHALNAAAPETSALEAALAEVERQIAAMSQALVAQDAPAAETVAAELRGALRGAMTHFAQVQQRGTMPPALRRRLAEAGGQIAAHREALLRATSALDQALDIILPREDAPAVYSATGPAGRPTGRVIGAS